MVVLALDQSTRASGWSVFENGSYVESGMIDMTKSKLDTDIRSFEMAKAIWRIIKKYKPEHLVMEETQQQSNVKTVIILARLQGMIVGYAEAHGVKVHILQPSKWRAALQYRQGSKVKRTELKQQSLDYIKENLGLSLPEDEAEASCIGIAAYKILNFE